MLSDYSQLLFDVQKKSNISITNIRDVKYLKEEIEGQLGVVIGFNTLRRLFGFLEKNNPSITTLNTLSKYLGFVSFANYKNHHANYSEWYFQQNLLRMQLQKKISEKEIEKINIGLLDGKNVIYLAYFLTYQIEKNNLETIELIFKKVNFKNVSGTQFHKFSTVISLSLLNIPEKKALKIYEALINYDIFRNNIPLLFIDYSNLNSRYYNILKLIEKNAANDSDLLFVSLMFFYKEFYSENILFFNYELKKPLGFSGFYSVLKGRYYGWSILQSQKVSQKLKKEIFEECSSIKVSYFLEEIIPALIIKNEYQFLNELIDKYYEEIFESDVWSSMTTNSIYLIGLSNVNWFTDNISMAKRNLELVELEKVELGYYEYVALFYQLTRIKISFTEKNIVENKIAYSIVNELVNKTKLIKFKSEAQKFLI
ncbi:MAG: hypothetical protein ACOYBS_04350 [Flavobacterium sp.]